MRRPILVLVLVAVLFAALIAQTVAAPITHAAPAAGTMYTWNQAGSAAWTTASNWTPTRTTPAATDILVIDGSVTASPTLTAVPTQTISQLVLKNNSKPTFQASAAATLTIGGDTGTDFDIPSGSTLTLGGSTAIAITLSTGATGSVSGSMTVTGAAHRLTATDAGGVTFNNGGTFTTGTGFTGNAFGTANLNSVVFSSGSTYVSMFGGNPFGATAPNSVVTFQAGSLYSHRQTGSPALSNRTYANFELDGNVTVNISSAFGNPWTVDKLEVRSGSQLNWTHTSGTGNAAINIKGDLVVNGTLSFSNNSSVAYSLYFNGGSLQTVSGTGTITLPASLAGVQVNNSNGVTLARALTVAWPLTVQSASTLSTSATLTVNGTATINGSFQINEGGYGTGGTWSYGAAATLIFNSSSSYGVNSDHVYWPTSNGPANVTVQGGGITMNVARSVSGLFQTSAGVTNGNNLTLNGTAQINAGGYFSGSPTYGTGSTLVYKTGTTYGRGNEWNATSGAGYPYNVQLSNNTTLNYPNGTNVARAIAGNLTIDGGSSLYMDWGDPVVDTSLTVPGSVTINGLLKLGDGAGGDLNVGGGWTNNGTFDANGRAVSFNGGSAQTIGGTAATTFAYLTVNNANVVTLNADATVNSALTLTNGNLDVGTKTLTLGSGATVGGGTFGATKMIVADGGGQVCKLWLSGSFTFPIGDNTGTAEYSPATLTLKSGAFPGGRACLQVKDEKHPKMPGTNYITRYWPVTPTGSGFTCDVDFTYADDDIVGTEAKLSTAKWDSLWTVFGAANTGANQLSATVSSFSDFSAGESGPLAVDLAYFTATLVDGRPVLTWETVSEQANAGFDLYRSESEQGPWVKLTGSLIPAAAPGSAEGHAYAWTDTTAVQGTYWYRLEDVDLGGSRTSHGPVRIDLAAPNAVSVSRFSARFDLAALLKALFGLR